MRQIQLLKKYDLSIKGVRGQHLLVDENIQRKLIDYVNPRPGDAIVEIGPGLGAITEGLLNSGARVIAVERDRRFVEILKGELSRDYKNLKLIEKDFLQVDLKRYAKGNTKLRVVGNIPYYITSAILLYLISYRKCVDAAYLMVQREIADRLFAQPGSKAYGRLSLLARFYADVDRAFEISRNCFSPKPEVDSTFVGLTFYRSLPANVDERLLFHLIKAAFGKRRKNIQNAITEGLSQRLEKREIGTLLRAAGIKPTTRAENLLLKDFIRLGETFSSYLKSKTAI